MNTRSTPVLVVLALGLVPFHMLASSRPGDSRSAPKTVAVLRYDNGTDEERYDNLGRGLASMMISDLSAVESVQLVERERLDDLLDELALQHSAYADSSTAQTVGQIVGAEYVVTGAFVSVDPNMRLDARVVRVETAEIVKTASVTGEQDELFDLEKRLADELIDGLDIALSPEEQERLRAQQEANRIDDVETAVAYSDALYYLDSEQYVEALEKMNVVRRRAPASQIVQLTYDYAEEQARKAAEREVRKKANRGVRRLLHRGKGG